MIETYNHLVIKGGFKSAPKNLKILNIVFDQIINSTGDMVIKPPLEYENEEQKTMTICLLTKTGYATLFVNNKEIPSGFILQFFTAKSVDGFNIMKQLNDWFGLVNGIECKMVKK
mgnify:CR=1 FL=1